jgi:acetoacetate decarboxylase
MERMLMLRDFKLKGFSYPLTPKGISSVIPSFPWHYGTEYLNILFRADPSVVREFLPEPLELGPDPGLCYAAFSKWWSVSEEAKDMPSINPERTQYREAAIWASCSFKGNPGQICLFVWVDNDFTMARGWFMGFPKKLGQVYITEYHDLNPAMPHKKEGTVFKGIASANGERLMEGTITLESRINPSDLPYVMTSPLYHIRHFPNITNPNEAPSVLELVKLKAENKRLGKDIWKGSGTLKFYESEIEEHFLLRPEEVLGAYMFSSGYTFPGGEVLYSWV